MPSYREQSAAGTTYQRCYAVTVQNPMGGDRIAQFHEQLVATFAGETITREAGSCGLRFVPGGEFPLLDPANGEPTGQIVSHAQLYAVLYSAYMHAAEVRDQLGPAPVNLAPEAQS